MSPNSLVVPMVAHIVWVTLLYAALTVARAPAVWGVGRSTDGSNPWDEIEHRISANLGNQFEWPLFFYVICVLLLVDEGPVASIQVALAWIFFVGRILHSGVQIVINNVRLRGLVFTISFAAVLGMWVVYLLPGNG